MVGEVWQWWRWWEKQQCGEVVVVGMVVVEVVRNEAKSIIIDFYRFLLNFRQFIDFSQVIIVHGWIDRWMDGLTDGRING